MNYTALGTTVYLLAGALLFYVWDRHEMKKDVPYGDSPSVMPLNALRTSYCLICVVFGGAVLVLCLISVSIGRSVVTGEKL